MLNRVRKVPPEAFHIAAQFDQQASQVRQQAQHLAKVKAQLSANWKGKSANLFQQQVDPKIKELNALADWLAAKANEIRSKQVETWE